MWTPNFPCIRTVTWHWLSIGVSDATLAGHWQDLCQCMTSVGPATQSPPNTAQDAGAEVVREVSSLVEMKTYQLPSRMLGICACTSVLTGILTLGHVMWYIVPYTLWHVRSVHTYDIRFFILTARADCLQPLCL